MKIPLAARWQWTYLFVLQTIGIIVGAFVVYPLAVTGLKIKYQVLRRPVPKNPYGEDVMEHTRRYKREGSSGQWSYWNVGGLFWLWGNDEDGFLGEPTGKWSSNRDGKERSWISMYLWCLRNPFNNGKRNTELFACPVESCHIEWYDSEGVLHMPPDDPIIVNDDPIIEGEYLCVATHLITDRKYYGYRSVIDNVHKFYGFKIKPRHAYQEFDADDKLKGFTFRRVQL